MVLGRESCGYAEGGVSRSGTGPDFRDVDSRSWDREDMIIWRVVALLV